MPKIRIIYLNTTYLWLILSFLMINCTENNSQIQQSQVGFARDSIKIFTDSLYNPEIEIFMDPPAAMSSTITLRVESERDNFFTTEPPVIFGNLTLPVSANDASTSFRFNPTTNNLGGATAYVEFEIIALGQGLLAQPLQGRFLTVQIADNAVTDFSAPFQEDFAACLSGIFPPEGWQEIEVEQNNENSAHWGCITSPQSGLVINAFVGGSTDGSSAEVWMVSPEIDLGDLSNPALRFSVDRRFSPPDPGLAPFDLLVSTDYNGENFESANWERFAAGFSAIEANDPASDGFSASGDLDLSAYAGESLSIAFVYRAGAPGTANATILRIADFSIE